MNGFGDNPFDDGLDFVGCPPQPTELKLPRFPKEFKQECKLICWGRCLSTPDGERRMTVVVEDFAPDPGRCGVFHGVVRFLDSVTGDEWYVGKLQFYYTRNYVYAGSASHEEKRKLLAFRFVTKGDLIRVADELPEWDCFILCTKHDQANEGGVPSYEEIFVYGGLEIVCDVDDYEMKGFMLSLGHNDGWYTHHPKCSARPIDWHGTGDYIGHYCDRGWLFVSPGRNFVFDPGLRPPSGRFFDEALRNLNEKCYTEEAVKYGEFELTHIRCIHSYQKLEGWTECETPFRSTHFCQGMVHSGKRLPWMTFFSMGYWMDRLQREKHILHLVEGNIKLDRKEFEEYKYGLSFYGFTTQREFGRRKLVDLVDNATVIGQPADSKYLLYLYNAGRMYRDPKVRKLTPKDLKLPAKLLREELIKSKDRELCPFLEDEKE